MPHDYSLGKPEFAADQPHLVLEKLTEGFDKPKLHPFGQTPDIVMRLYSGRRPFEGYAFDHVRVESALREIVGVLDLGGLALEDLDKKIADYLPLAFRVRDPFQSIEELGGCVDVDEIYCEMIAEYSLNGFGLALSQKSVIDENAVKPLSYGPVKKDRNDRGVHAAAQCADYGIAPVFLLNSIHSRVHEGFHRPGLATPANAEQKILQDVLAAGRMRHFRM